MDKLLEIFKKLNIPIRYIGTKDELIVPFGIYQRLGENFTRADNKVIYKQINVRLELYFNDLTKQIEVETRLENLLEENYITFNKTEDILLEDKETILKYYEIGVIMTCQQK